MASNLETILMCHLPDSFYLFMDYIENTLFATSCDAFANMKVSFCEGAH